MARTRRNGALAEIEEPTEDVEFEVGEDKIIGKGLADSNITLMWQQIGDPKENLWLSSRCTNKQLKYQLDKRIEGKRVFRLAEDLPRGWKNASNFEVKYRCPLCRKGYPDEVTDLGTGRKRHGLLQLRAHMDGTHRDMFIAMYKGPLEQKIKDLGVTDSVSFDA